MMNFGTIMKTTYRIIFTSQNWHWRTFIIVGIGLLAIAEFIIYKNCIYYLNK